MQVSPIAQTGQYTLFLIPLTLPTWMPRAWPTSNTVSAGAIAVGQACGAVVTPTPMPTPTATATPTPGAGSGDTVADRVFGQGNSFTVAGCNQGGISASSMCQPFDVAIEDGGNLYASDFTNNRVLQFDDALTGDTVADRVFGQAGNFTSNSCNTGGFGSPPTAGTLCGPQGVAVDGAGNLYIADYNNNRVLEFDNPLATDMVPDRVFGQAGSFIAGACNMGSFPSASSLCGPNGVTLDGAGNLYIAESANNRVLVYHNPLATDTVADRVFGQFGSFTSNGCNTGGRGSAPDANTMCFPVGIAVDNSGNLYVSDRDNSRVLEYNNALATDTVADKVIGQPDFISNTCNTAGMGSAPTANKLCFPQAVTVDSASNLFVSDTFNHRVLQYDSPLTTRTCCRIGCSGRGAVLPQTAAILAGNLAVQDFGQHFV